MHVIKYVQEVSWSGYGDALSKDDPTATKIINWAESLGLRIEGGGVITNPQTFQPNRVWYFENEEVKTLFLLKWSNI